MEFNCRLYVPNAAYERKIQTIDEYGGFGTLGNTGSLMSVAFLMLIMKKKK